jgi:hypothetical protein
MLLRNGCARPLRINCLYKHLFERPEKQKTESPARLELRSLERMIDALCEHIERLTLDARSRGELATREHNLQLEAFAERRTQALQILKTVTCESHETCISRLERLMEALECSRAYFLSSQADSVLQKAAV